MNMLLGPLRTLKALQVRVALAAVLAVVVAGQSPASAHEGKYFHGKDFLLLYDDYQTVALCDEEKDGHYVSAVLHSGASKTWQIDNANGADGDCVVDKMAWNIDFISVCEEDKLCHSYGV